MHKKILIFIVLIAGIMSAFVVAGRYKAEERNSNIEIAVDMSDFQNLAGEMGIDFKDMAAKMQGSGVTTLAVQEATLSDLSDRGLISYMPLGEFISGVYSNGIGSSPVAQQVVYIYKTKQNTPEVYNSSVIITKNKDVFDFLKHALEKRVKLGILQNGNSYAIIIKQKLKGLEQLGLGFYEPDFQYAKSLGFVNVIARMQNVVGIDEEGIDEKISQIKKYKIGVVVFGGDSVLGYDAAKIEDPTMLKYAAERFKEEDLINAIIEKPADEEVEKVQKGIKAFSRLSGYVSTKVFSVDMDSKKSIYPEALNDQWSRAIAERNVRIIYVRPFISSYKSGEANFEDSMIAVSLLVDRVRDMGLKRDIVKGLGNIEPRPYQRVVIFAGIFAGALLLLLNFVEIKNLWIWIVGGAGILGLGVFFVLNHFIDILGSSIGDLLIKVAAFSAAVVFSSLAVCYVVNTYQKYFDQDGKLTLISVIIKSIELLVTAAIISAVGGFMVAGLLAESKYMLKLDIFRGVKLSFVIPIIVYLAYYVKRAGVYIDKEGKPIDVSLQIKKLLNTSVTIKYVIVGVAVLLGITYLLLRSGNTAANLTSSTELGFRAYLERLFVSRPRSKELLSFPLLMVLVYAALNKRKILSFFIMFLGAIGLADIVNSFSHIRMPLKMAAFSTIYSIGFAIVSGIIVVVLWDVIYIQLRKKYQRKARETN